MRLIEDGKSQYFQDRFSSVFEKEEEKHMNKKKHIQSIMLILSFALVLIGFVMLGGAKNDHRRYEHDYGSLTRADTSVTFGGDFQTYSVQNSALTANAVSDLYEKFSIAVGFFFIFTGGMSACITLLKTDFTVPSQKPRGHQQDSREMKDSREMRRQRREDEKEEEKGNEEEEKGNEKEDGEVYE